jgi:hypothetical protein
MHFVTRVTTIARKRFNLGSGPIWAALPENDYGDENDMLMDIGKRGWNILFQNTNNQKPLEKK